MDNLWIIISDIMLIIMNIIFVINKMGYWKLNLIAAICLTISVSFLIADYIIKKKGWKK